MIAVICGNTEEFEKWKTEYPDRLAKDGAFSVSRLEDIELRYFDEVQYYETGWKIGDRDTIQKLIDRRLGWRK